MPEEMTAPADPGLRARLEVDLMIILAGRCGEIRARRGSYLDRVAFHEASHLCVGAALGRATNGIAIDVSDTPLGTRFRGIASFTPKQGEPDHPTFDGFEKMLSDYDIARQLSKLILLLASPSPAGWLAYLRTQWWRADAILDRHWLAVRMLAQEVREKKIVPRARAQEILDRWMPVKEHSLVAFFEAQGGQVARVGSAAADPDSPGGGARIGFGM
jgi:hypothetical protein